MSHLYLDPFLNWCIYVFLLFQNTSLFVGVKRFCVFLGLHQRGSLISRLLHKSVSQHTMKRAVALTKKEGKRFCSFLRNQYTDAAAGLS